MEISPGDGYIELHLTISVIFLFLRRQFEREKNNLAWRRNIIGQGRRSNYPYGEESLLDKAGLGFFPLFVNVIYCNARRIYYRGRW